VDVDLLNRARSGLHKAARELIRQQDGEGFWCAELEGDSILQSEYILLKWIIGKEDDPRLPRIAAYLRSQQRPDGTWGQYPGSGPDLSATVKGYFALKLVGDSVDAPHMVRARQAVLLLGGAEKSNTYSRFYYAALGQLHYGNVPMVPPEVVYLPKWSYFHLDKISAWSRTMLMPLAIVTTFKPVRQLPDHLGIRELYCNTNFIDRPMMEFDRRLITWRNFFVGIDRALKIVHPTRLNVLRDRALRQVEQWVLQHTQHSDGLGAIYPPMVYIIIALRCLGYDWDNAHLREAQNQLDRLMIDDGQTIRFQPCFSPVWDTGYASFALTEIAEQTPEIRRSLEQASAWLVSKECRHVAGDWKNNVRRDIEPSGWAFEFNNAWYPDVDDTAMVAMALHRAGVGKEAEASSQRGVDWIFAMQCEDGGWAAFDRTVDRPILEQVPFADHNAIQDPSCADITGRVLECLGHHGYRTDQPAVFRAIAYIQSRQESDGCWYGRWGVNYIYGTFQMLCGLASVGVDMTENWVQRAGQWLKSVQQPDGSFGESANSYEDPSLRGQGPSTASQTSWGVMGMMAVFGPADPDVQRGIQWLLKNQLTSDDPTSGDRAGSWREDWFTGTGFPRVFYLRYHLYRLYFPVMCLGRWTRLAMQGD
jgi:squalene-hopene/tetraprenyl-beta-curcumene cyclase